MSTLLVGDATTTYTNADNNEGGSIVAWKFTASTTGTVDTLEFRTSTAAQTGVTSLVLGIFADSSGSPAATALGTATFTGTPAANTWITVTGLSVAVTAGTAYWLAMLPLPAGTGKLVFMNEAATSGGTNVMASTTNGHSNMTSIAWQGPFAVGPAGFQALTSSGTPIALAGVGLTDTNSESTTTVKIPLAGPGLTGSVATSALGVGGTALGAGGLTGSQATAVLTVGIPLAGSGVTGSKATGTIGVPFALGAVGQSGSIGIGIPFVLVQSLQALGTTDTSALGALNLGSLSGQGLTGSIGQATVSIKIPIPGIGTTASSGVATLSLGVQEHLAGFGSSASQAIATLGEVVPLLGAGSSGSALTATISVAVPLGGAGQTGSLAFGGILVGGAFSGFGATGSKGIASLSVVESVSGTGLTDSLGRAALAITVPLAGIGSANDSGNATLFLGAHEALVGLGLTSSQATGFLTFVGRVLAHASLVDDLPYLVTLTDDD